MLRILAWIAAGVIAVIAAGVLALVLFRTEITAYYLNPGMPFEESAVPPAPTTKRRLPGRPSRAARTRPTSRRPAWRRPYRTPRRRRTFSSFIRPRIIPRIAGTVPSRTRRRAPSFMGP